MRGGNAIDQKFLAGGVGEVEKAADMVVLVEGGKKTFGFGGRKTESRESDGFAKGARPRLIQSHEFA